ncbi:MAG: Gfo/Idh/MocA family oxidoreductase [Acidobacteria bacterium]|nr:Gfo/Idh/MocA family oxidoreductase [Acidobacteriota bacterium]
MSATSINRREFAALTAGSMTAPAQERKIRIGVIGCGWYGMVDLKAAFDAGGVDCVALCDIDTAHLDAAVAEAEKAQGSRPKTFKDYRELLDLPGLEAVIVATPPHWHALPFLAACRKGLDIYCEKPLAYDIREGQAMGAAAEKSGRVIQIGFQRRQSDAVQQAAGYIRSGAPGRIVQADVQIHYKAAMLDARVQAPPATLDWELWCGPGPKLPYRPNAAHRSWRLEAAVGNGHLVDWGIHLIDATRVILGESMPNAIQAMGGLYALKGQITTPDTLTAQFDFDRCPVVWRHRLWGASEYSPEVSNGIFFYGEKETVFVTDNKWMVIPSAKGAERRLTEVKTAGESGLRHMRNFLECVRSRSKPLCRIQDAFQSTATVQLGMIACHTGSRIQWDRQKLDIPGNPAAQKLLKREYRPPYRHPYAG